MPSAAQDAAGKKSRVRWLLNKFMAAEIMELHISIVLTLVQIARLENKVGRFPAQLERDLVVGFITPSRFGDDFRTCLLQIAFSSSFHNFASGHGGAGERNFIDIHMRCEGGSANCAQGGYSVNYPRREAVAMKVW